MRFRPVLTAALAGSLLLLTACAATQRPSGGAPTPPRDASPVVAIMSCGSLPVRATFKGEQMTLEAGAESYALEQVRSGPGAKYEVPGDRSTSYWSKGDRAMLVIKGQTYPECEPAGALLLQAGEWVVEDINQGGIIDRTRVTLNFGNDGRVSGRATCNNYAGAYAVAGNALRISQLVSTRMACVDALGEQESRFMQALEKVSRFSVSDTGALILKAESGDSLTARLQ